MARTISWETDMERVLARAKAEGKEVLLNFHNPGCIGCRQMDTVTYPDERVATYITQNLIPLRLPYNDKQHATEFKIKWTPTLIVLDTDGRESHRMVGFLAPDELIPALQLGVGKAHYEAERFAQAISAFDELLHDHSKSAAAPEAIFFRGVSIYKHTDNPKALREVYDRLTVEYPDSEWTKKAYPYRLIE